MGEINVGLIDSAFSDFTKSASLREENRDVEPTYFQWPIGQPGGGKGLTTFLTDGAIAKTPLRQRFSPGTKPVAWLIEPRCLRPENYRVAKERAHEYYAVLSYDKEFLKDIPNGRWYPLGGSSIAFEKWGIYPKTKDVCLFYSGKDSTAGHRLRKAIAEEFAGRIDVYGAGVGNPVDSKFEVLKDYRYCVVVESCNIEGYFSEKLIDAISVGCVPIYCGGNVKKYFGDKGFPVFSTPKNLRIQLMGDTDHRIKWYKEFARGRFSHFNVWANHAKSYRICEDYIYKNYGDLFT